MKTFIFDFDGTLVDSMDDWAGTMLRILEERGISYPDDIIKIITPLGYGGTADYFIEKLGVKESKEKLISLMGEYCVDAYRDRILAKETVADTLVELKKRGHSLNVLTASPHIALDPCLKRNGIYDLFDNVWSCDDFNTTKSDPEIYGMAAEKIGTTVEECIFLDDNVNAVATAKSANMGVIGVYDKSSDGKIEEMKRICGRYIFKFSELLELV